MVQRLTVALLGLLFWAAPCRAGQANSSDLDCMGLVPIMWSTGTGTDVMKRIGAPMIGGIFTSFIMELLVYPAIYTIWKWGWEVKPALLATQSE